MRRLERKEWRVEVGRVELVIEGRRREERNGEERTGWEK
jgi:hypothetical protein